MTPERIANIEAGRREIVERYGDWTAHNIHLGGGQYTLGGGLRGDEVMARRLLQIVSDALDRPLEGSRVLDLACLEGLYAVEFAHHGAQALGIEIREANLAKARFAKDVLALDNVEFAQDDVRNLSAEKYGLFDAVICIGILYHLDAPDVFDFVLRMGEVCRRCLVVDTHVSLTEEVSLDHGGETYTGKYFTEHAEGATPEQKEAQLWASIDNMKSFWPTRDSLYAMLGAAGFTTVFECHYPPVASAFADRVTLLALKGRPQEVITSPQMKGVPHGHCPDVSGGRGQRATVEPPPSLVRRIGRALPGPVKKLVKRVVR